MGHNFWGLSQTLIAIGYFKTAFSKLLLIETPTYLGVPLLSKSTTKVQTKQRNQTLAIQYCSSLNCTD